MITHLGWVIVAFVGISWVMAFLADALPSIDRKTSEDWGAWMAVCTIIGFIALALLWGGF